MSQLTSLLAHHPTPVYTLRELFLHNNALSDSTMEQIVFKLLSTSTCISNLKKNKKKNIYILQVSNEQIKAEINKKTEMVIRCRGKDNELQLFYVAGVRTHM